MIYNFDRGAMPYTDLACERRRCDTDLSGVEYTRSRTALGEWERLKITSEAGEKSIGRPRGNYNTLNLSRMDLLDSDAQYFASREIAKEITKLSQLTDTAQRKILVVGLGNRALTSDSLGPAVCDGVKPTRHIKESDAELFKGLECAEITVISPGVSAKTGLESAELISSLCKLVLPEIVLAVDSITTCSYERLGSTVQITDSGICPGSGLFNSKKAISRDTLGVPVISVGVPTVIDARVPYLDGLGDKEITDAAKIPSPRMFVSPKEIDEIVNYASHIISNAINFAFGIG